MTTARKRLGPLMLFFPLLGCQAGPPPLISESDRGIDLHENVIHGTVAFSNQNPEILALLHSPEDMASAADQGISSLTVAARSIDISPPLDNTSTTVVDAPPNTRVRAGYQIVNQAGPIGDGIAYRLRPSALLDGDRDYYVFSPVSTPPLVQIPAPPLTVEVEECAGIIALDFLDADGGALPIGGGVVDAYRQEAPGLWVYQAHGEFRAQVTRAHLAVRGDGTLYRLEVYYERDDALSPIPVRYHRQLSVEVGCDEIVTVGVVVAEEPAAWGQIVGEVDMRGYSEHRIGNLTRMRAFHGPFANLREAVIAEAPSQGRFLLDRLLPSDAEVPAENYWVTGYMAFGLGSEYQYFETPYLGGEAHAVPVAAGQRVDLAQTFVMDPGVIRGQVTLRGPVAGHGGGSSKHGSQLNGGSCLAAVQLAADINGDDGDGIPDDLTLEASSALEVVGSNRLATGARYRSIGGLARTPLSGAFDDRTGVFAGAYRMVLAGLAGDAAVWRTGRLRLRMHGDEVPGHGHQDAAIEIFDNRAQAEVELAPGEEREVDVDYCFGELRLTYRSQQALFYQPEVTASGADVGYSVALTAAGTPHSYATAAREGEVVMCIPAGSYDLAPRVTAITPDGGLSLTELPVLHRVEVGCGEVKTIDTDVVLDVDETPECTGADELLVRGHARLGDDAVGGIDEISVAVGEAAPVLACRDCGTEAEFAVGVPLAACENSLRVRAQTSSGLQAEVVRQVVRDDAAPVFDGCTDLEIAVNPGASGAIVDYPLIAEDDCTAAPAVDCDVPSGAFFAAGTTTPVTCSARDTCGAAATCEFVVSVIEVPDVPGCDSGIADDADCDGVAREFDCDDDDDRLGALLYQDGFDSDSGFFSTTPELSADPWFIENSAISSSDGGQQALLGPAQDWGDVAVIATVSAIDTQACCGHDGQTNRWRTGVLLRANLDDDQDEGYHGYRCALGSNAEGLGGVPSAGASTGHFMQLAVFEDTPEDDIDSECTGGVNSSFDQLARTNHALVDVAAGDVAELRFFAVGEVLHCEMSDGADTVVARSTDNRFATGTVGLSTLNMLGSFESIRVCQAFAAPAWP